jgi:hypothetical protein
MLDSLGFLNFGGGAIWLARRAGQAGGPSFCLKSGYAHDGADGRSARCFFKLALPSAAAHCRRGVRTGHNWRNFFRALCVPHIDEDFMRSYFANLSPALRSLLAVAVIALSYPLVSVALSALLRAVVPASVRSVLSFL